LATPSDPLGQVTTTRPLKQPSQGSRRYSIYARVPVFRTTCQNDGHAHGQGCAERHVVVHSSGDAECRRVPQAGLAALDAAVDHQVSGDGNLFLGMSAHVNRLPFVLAAIGLTVSGGTSRKADHEKVNQFLNVVIDAAR
jgi:hypothetical protein